MKIASMPHCRRITLSAWKKKLRHEPYTCTGNHSKNIMFIIDLTEGQNSNGNGMNELKVMNRRVSAVITRLFINRKDCILKRNPMNTPFLLKFST